MRMKQNIVIGDYVTTQFNKGYFRVEKIVLVKDINQQNNQVVIMTWLLLKKALNNNFECKNLVAESIHIDWCKKVDDVTKKRIDTVFSDNPKEKRKFDEFTASTQGVFWSAVACYEKEELKLHDTMRKIKNNGLTVEEFNNLPTIKKYKYDNLKDKEVKDKKIFRIMLINIDIETNKDNWLIFRLDNYKQV